MRGTTVPMYYYTFANDEEEAKQKVSLKWGEYDPKAVAREIEGEDLEKIVIATNFF